MPCDHSPRLGPLLLSLALVTGCVGDDFESCKDTVCSETTAGGSSGTGGSAGTGNSNSGGVTSTGGTGANVGGTGGIGGSTGGPTASGGTSGGDGESGAPSTCDDECSGSTPVCDEAAATCVQCVDSTEHCDTPTPACDLEAHECVECVETADCDTGVCDTGAHRCVECLETEDCDAELLCDTEEQLCVECLENADCTNPLEAFCDAGSCSPCGSNDDCAHLTDTTVCDTGAGECVECTMEGEAACGGTSCNPATQTCTTTPVGTRDDCQTCVADSECIGNDGAEPVRRCVPMEFAGEPRGQAYCLKRQVAGCARPFTVLTPAVSVSGASEESYCGIDQNLATCEAVLDLVGWQTCPEGEDAECGCPRDEDGKCTAAGQAGLCRSVGGVENQCTYECGDVGQCVNGRTCANLDPDFCQ